MFYKNRISQKIELIYKTKLKMRNKNSKKEQVEYLIEYFNNTNSSDDNVYNF